MHLRMQNPQAVPSDALAIPGRDYLARVVRCSSSNSWLLEFRCLTLHA
jgi:hypothetical protein